MTHLHVGLESPMILLSSSVSPYRKKGLFTSAFPPVGVNTQRESMNGPHISSSDGACCYKLVC